MEVTYKTRGIILEREAYGENDSRVFIYTPDFGKLALVARGTQKLSSKLAAHLEPLNFCEIMVVRGKQYDYVGNAISEEVFAGIKDDYAKTAVAGEILKLVNEVTREKQAEREIFLLLKDFLAAVSIEYGPTPIRLYILKFTFILKFISLLGYAPELDKCVVCRKKISGLNNKFNFAKGGVVCQLCDVKDCITISSEAIKAMCFLLISPIAMAVQVRINERAQTEIADIINGVRLYHLT